MYNYRDTMATKCNPFSESRRTVSIKRKKTEVTLRNKKAKNSSRQKIYKKEIFKTERITVRKQAKIK